MRHPFAVDLGLSIAADLPELRLVACTITEGASEITHAEVEVACEESVHFAGAIEADATLTLWLGAGAARRWTLKLGRTRFVGIAAGKLHYRLDLHAPLWTLGLKVTTRKFRNMSAQAIVSEVLRACGVQFEWHLTRPTKERPYTVQYRETHLAFVSRLLEFEGIAYGINPDGTLILTDSSPAAAPVDGRADFELLEAAGALERGELGIHDFRLRARVTPGAASVNDYNWKQPQLSLLRTAYTEENPDLETYDDLAGYRDPAEGEHLARIRLQAQRLFARSVEGRANVPSFEPLRCFTFGDAAGPAFAGEYLLVQVVHQLRLAAYTDAGSVEQVHDGMTYENQFVAIPRAVPFRPPRRTPRPTVAGSHTARVRGPAGSEIHTDAHGRFKAQFHWDREATGTDADSRWLRMTQETATSMTLARVGWEVAVGYIDGDPDRPIGLSRQMNGVMRPAYALPANKNMMSIKTPSSPASGGYNELKLDDSLGSMGFHLRAERDFVGLVKNDKSERIGHNETHFVRANLTHIVDHDQSVTIGANSTTSCGKSEQLMVTKDRTFTVAGSENVDIGADASHQVEGNDSERVGAVRLTIAGGFKLPDLKAIARGLVPVSSLSDLKGALTGALASGAQAALGSALGGAGSDLAGLLGGTAGLLPGASGGQGAMGGLAPGAFGPQGAPGGFPPSPIDTLGAQVGFAPGPFGPQGAQGGPGGFPSNLLGILGTPEGGFPADPGRHFPSGPEGGFLPGPFGGAQGVQPDFASGPFGPPQGAAGGGGLPGAFGGAGGMSSILGGAGGLIGGAGGLIGGAGGLIGGAGGLPGLMGGAMPSLGDSLGAGLGAAGASLQSLIPTPDGIASQLRGLASFDGIVNQITTGSISRSAEKSFSKTVGAAFISVAIGNVSTQSKLKYAETVGGVKLTVTATGGIAEKVDGVLVITVGGAIIREAKEGISVKSTKSKVSVGGTAMLSSKAAVTLEGKAVTVQAGMLSVNGPGATIAMTPGSISLNGDLRLRAAGNIVITGAVDNLTI
jgi:type VI secretion system secreted protein VgrG